MDRARTKHNQLNQEKLALEDDLDELKQNQKTLENELREGTEITKLMKQFFIEVIRFFIDEFWPYESFLISQRLKVATVYGVQNVR